MATYLTASKARSYFDNLHFRDSVKAVSTISDYIVYTQAKDGINLEDSNTLGLIHLKIIIGRSG